MNPISWQYEDDASCGAVACAGEERAALERIAKSTSRSHRAVLQGKGLLLASEGVANYEIARRVGVCANTVRKWRRSFRALLLFAWVMSGPAAEGSGRPG
jgi:hypothetical protein